MTKGRAPQEGLEPQACEMCGAGYQPYRENQRTCSRQCYRRLPDVVAKVALHHAQEHIRSRKNVARRVGTAADPDYRRRINLRGNLRQYGVTVEQYEALRDVQGNRCAICGDPPDPNGVKSASRLHVDHDHLTGKLRDLLCCRCNQGIGYFKDDPVLFEAAAAYITRHRA